MTRLAIDIGQGGTRVRSIDDQGGTRSLQLDVGGNGRSGTLEDVVHRAIAEVAGPRTRLEAVAVGATGVFGAPADASALAHTLNSRRGVQLLLIADDGVTSLLGALGHDHGVVVAAGTGLVAVGAGPDRTSRIDGVGSQIGDEGSGWWIGRRGLIAALSTLDGREGSSPVLLGAARAVYGDPVELPRTIANSPAAAALVADFAEQVVSAARAGDLIARNILGEAGRLLARACVAAARGAGLNEREFVWSLTGGLAAALDMLNPTMSEEIVHHLPQARRAEPLGDALDGAQALLDTDTEVFGPMVRRYTSHDLAAR